MNRKTFAVTVEKKYVHASVANTHVANIVVPINEYRYLTTTLTTSSELTSVASHQRYRANEEARYV